MAGRATHQEYYEQFVTPAICNQVQHDIGIRALRHSHDEHLNDIPLHLWDAIALRTRVEVSPKLREAGDFWSSATGVCIAKVAARMLVHTDQEAPI